MESILICVAVCLIGGLLATRVASKLNLPAVTAYLVMGLLIGPYMIGRLGVTGLGFSTMENVESYKIITQVALGFIAFSIGNEFRLHDLQSMGKQAITIGILQAVITTALVDVILIVFHLVFPQMLSLSAAVTLGAIAAATAPAATLMVVRQYKASGPLTKLLLMVVAIDDAVGLILFALSFGVATAFESGVIDVFTVIVDPLLEIVLSFVLGGICGFVLNYLEKFFHSRSKRLALALSFVFLSVGLSMIEIEVGRVHLGFSLLLVCMVTGTVFCNICNASEEIMERVEAWTSPLNVLFFVISGAELDLKVISNPMVLLVGITYIIGRSSGKIGGAYISCAMTKCSDKIKKNLGITLLPQAGVALGMASTASALADGAIVRNVVLFSVLIYELVGPALTKRSLIDAGEIKLHERKSSRQENAEITREGYKL